MELNDLDSTSISLKYGKSAQIENTTDTGHENMNIENSSIKRDVVRENILKIAQEIFSKYGYKKTTLDDIANAVRKGKSSLYYYFSSKEDLFQEVIQKEADILREELSKVLQKDIDPAEKLRDYVMTKITTYRQLANCL